MSFLLLPLQIDLSHIESCLLMISIGIFVTRHWIEDHVALTILVDHVWESDLR
jgi:hypothetical protein